MKTTQLSSLALGILIGAVAIEANGQSAYFNAVTNLNPVGYWPMHEVEAAAQGDIETNYGTLGPLGEGFYPDWAGATPWIVRGAPGILTNDDNRSVHFIRPNSGGPPGNTYTNALFVPHTSSLTTLNPPFTVECWFYPTNYNSQDIWAQAGDVGLNSGNTASGLGSLAGLRLVWMSSANTGFQLYGLDGGQNNIGFTGSSGVNSSPSNNWYYLVVTCDQHTNFLIYTNGVQAPQNSVGGTAVNGPGTYTPDYWTPMTIGGGHGGGGNKAVAGFIDEFAVYTNVISDITTHYNDAINSASQGSYFHDVTNDNPVVYLRMNAPAAYTPPGVGTWPALMNYGMTNGVAVGNGVYTPGTAPGLVTSSPVNPNGVPFAGVPSYLTALNGVSSFGDAGNAAAYNPVGSNANFTVLALFRGYPCDGRVQSIVSHGTNSWELDETTNGTLVFNAGNGNAAAGGTSQALGDVRTVGVYNDGNWHQVVAINQTNQVSIYVDGLLDTNGTPIGITSTNVIAGNAGDVMIGSDPNYTNNPAGAGRQFAGQICDVAFWTNALAANQVAMLYSNCEVAPYLTVQPQSYSINQGIDFTNMSVVVKGSPTLSYQWFTNGVALLGQTGSNLVLNPITSANASADYYVVVTNLYGSATSSVASLTVYSAPTFASYLPVTCSNAVGATITTNFMNLYAGANPVFSVAVIGSQPVGLFWFTNGVIMAGQNGTNIAITNVSAGTINVSCVASNLLGVYTNLWNASVLGDPANNANGLAPYPQQVLADNPIGYWRLNEGNDNGNGDDGYVAYDYAGGNDGIYTNVLLGQTSYSPTTDPSDTSATFGEFGSLPASDEFAGQIKGIDFSATNGANGEFTVEAWANGVNSGEFPQTFGSPLAGKGLYGVDDEFNLGIDSTKVHYRFYVRNAAGTTYTCGSGSMPPLDNNWHHVVGVCDEANGLLSLYYDGRLVNTAAIPTNSGVYKAAEPMNIGAGTSDGVNYTYQFIGNINDVAVYNHVLSIYQVMAQYSSVAPGGVPPYFIQTPPTSILVNQGSTLVLPAVADGGVPIGYYWTDVNANTNVAAGGTNTLPLNAALTVSNVPAAWNNDQLELTVTNASGSTNVYVTLNVYTNPPIIMLQLPTPVTVVQGNSYDYSVNVDGFPPFAYQWYSGPSAGSQSPIPNATNSTLPVVAGTPGSTYYSVAVSNQFGGSMSTTSQFISISSTRPTLTSGFDTNLLLLNPVGYWPMHETESPASGDIEVNYGSLGLLGEGFYPDWAEAPGGDTTIVRGVPGALTNDSDTAVNFTRGGSPPAGTYTNCLFVPHNSPLTTLVPPFTVECWFYPTNLTSEDIWAQCGDEGLNAGASGNGAGSLAGIRLTWMDGADTGFQIYGFNGSQYDVGFTGSGTYSSPSNHWYYLVVTCDQYTNFLIYTNGVSAPLNSIGSSPYTNGPESYTPDYWTPMTIGGGRGGTRAVAGYIDEFAVYTNVITDISAHYKAGSSGEAGAYFQAVTNDNPVIYLRMDASNYLAPATSFWPTLFNYGSAGANGLYTPGTAPGLLPGPSTNASGVSFNGLSGDVPMLSGVSSFADAGYANAYNPTGPVPFSVTAMFRGNPCDGRFQNIIGHSDHSWRIAMNNNGQLQCTLGTDPNSILNTSSSGGYNDQNWHQVVDVYAPNSNPSLPGTNSLYVDGVLVVSTNGVTTNGIMPGLNGDVVIASDPQYTNNSPGVGRQFAGQVCEVALFTNALTAGDVSALYAATLNPSQIPAYVAPEPPSSVSLAPGGALSLSAGVAGTANVGYQWQFTTNGGGTDVLQTGAGNSPLGASLTVPGVPLAWNGGQLELTVTNAYGMDSASVVLSVISPVNPNAPSIMYSVINKQLSLAWPTNLGWTLQAQTNSVETGLSNNWVNVSGSTTLTNILIPINLTNGTVFYRLTY